MIVKFAKSGKMSNIFLSTCKEIASIKSYSMKKRLMARKKTNSRKWRRVLEFLNFIRISIPQSVLTKRREIKVKT